MALTFDDGPHPASTPRLLDILGEHGAHATFFVLGKAVARYPDIVQRASLEGHAIGNHSWDHAALGLISGRERRSQIRACERAVAPYGQRLLRPPYGDQSIASRLDARWLGYEVIIWKQVAVDWLDHDAEWMAKRIVDKARPGSIVLFHDALYHTIEPQYADREPVLGAVDLILERLSDRYHFVTVPELLRYGRPQRRNWYRRNDPSWLNALQSQDGHIRQYAMAGGRGDR